jgi:hypothetical protein
VNRLITISLSVVVLLASACGDSSTDAQRPDGADRQSDTSSAAADDRHRETSGKGGQEGGAKRQKTRARKGSPGTSTEGGDRSGNATSGSRAQTSPPKSGLGAGGGGDAASADPAAPVPVGTHEYETEGYRSVSGNRATLPETTTLAANTPRDGLQRQVRDLRDRDGYGTVTESHLLYRPEGVFLAYVKVTSSFPGGFTDVREFKLPQPELLAPTEGGPGFGRSFSMEGSGTRADVRIAARRAGNVAVGGRTVEALLVETTIAFSGALEGEQQSAAWYYPKHLLVLRENVRTDVRNGPVRLQSEYTAALNRLP